MREITEATHEVFDVHERELESDDDRGRRVDERTSELIVAAEQLAQQMLLVRLRTFCRSPPINVHCARTQPPYGHIITYLLTCDGLA